MRVNKHVLLGLLVMGALQLGSAQHASAQELDDTAGSDPASVDVPHEAAAEELRVNELRLQIRRARISLLSTTGLLVVGTSLYVGSAARTWSGSGPDPLRVAGASLLLAGAAGMLASGIVLGVRNRRLNLLRPRDERVNRARIGLLSTTGVFVASGILWVAYASSCAVFGNDSGCIALGGAAAAMLLGGAAAMIATGALLGVRKRRLRASEQASHATRRRVRWDFVHNRLVF